MLKRPPALEGAFDSRSVINSIGLKQCDHHFMVEPLIAPVSTPLSGAGRARAVFGL
jgi:hypothetical protein